MNAIHVRAHRHPKREQIAIHRESIDRVVDCDNIFFRTVSRIRLEGGRDRARHPRLQMAPCLDLIRSLWIASISSTHGFTVLGIRIKSSQKDASVQQLQFGGICSDSDWIIIYYIRSKPMRFVCTKRVGYCPSLDWFSGVVNTFFYDG